MLIQLFMYIGLLAIVLLLVALAIFLDRRDTTVRVLRSTDIAALERARRRKR